MYTKTLHDMGTSSIRVAMKKLHVWVKVTLSEEK